MAWSSLKKWWDGRWEGDVTWTIIILMGFVCLLGFFGGKKYGYDRGLEDGTEQTYRQSIYVLEEWMKSLNYNLTQEEKKWFGNEQYYIKVIGLLGEIKAQVKNVRRSEDDSWMKKSEEEYLKRYKSEN